jgi:hypothetical protein
MLLVCQHWILLQSTDRPAGHRLAMELGSDGLRVELRWLSYKLPISQVSICSIEEDWERRTSRVVAS